MAQTYFLIPTADGEAKLANAQALGVPLKFTAMSVGDGNGALPIPNRDRKALINERRRAAINSLTQDPANQSQFIAEQVIPETEGGWWIREAGIHSEDGTLCYYANIPETYKPVLAEGSSRTQVVRLVCINTSGASVELKVDPAIVLATRGYVDTQIAVELAKLDSKQSVLVATTAPLAALSGLQTIDGVVLTAGARVLVKDQAAGKDNGIYLAAVGAWSRSADADAALEVTPGMLVPIEQGAANGDSIWQLVTDGVITIGQTALTFEMAAGRTGISAGTYSRVTVDQRGRVTGGSNPTPTESVAAPAIVATQAEVNDGTDDSHFVTPKKLLNWVKQATEAVLGMAKVATQAQTDAGADDATIVTPKKLRWGFASQLTATGFIAFPSWLGGWIVQWGIGPVSSSGGYSSVIFPTAFPNQCLTVICAYNGAGGSISATPTIVNAGAIGKTGCNLYTYLGTTATNGTTPAYIAIGR